MKIFDTLSGLEKELPSSEEIKIYSCGPTTYGPIHVGNLRSLLVADLLHRVLKYFGYTVKFVRNFTDIDDKILAASQGQDPLVFAQHWITCIQNQCKEFNILDVIEVKVSDSMASIILFIQQLIQKNYAYESQGHVFFSIKTYKDYGKLSKQKDLIEGFRISLQEAKRDQKDFVLWKPDTQYGWKSPWGQGRPGWHIECSAIIKEHLGETIHIHHGGQDLIFPHHENEIAQSESLCSKELASIWMHHAFVQLKEEKMSKSLGNSFLVEDLLKEYQPDFVRFLLLSVHYQDPIFWTQEKILESQQAYERIQNFLEETYSGNKNLPEEFLESFQSFLKNNFNTWGALSVIFDLIRYVRKHPDHTKNLKEFFVNVQNSLGIVFKKQQIEIPDYIMNLVKERENARDKKDFIKADVLKKEILVLGYFIEDTPKGSIVKKLV